MNNKEKALYIEKLISDYLIENKKDIKDINTEKRKSLNKINQLKMAFTKMDSTKEDIKNFNELMEMIKQDILNG